MTNILKNPRNVTKRAVQHRQVRETLDVGLHCGGIGGKTLSIEGTWSANKLPFPS